MSGMLADWRADPRALLVDTWYATAPWVARAAAITIISLVGLMMARAGFGGLALVALGGGLVVALLGLTRAVHEFILSAPKIWRGGFYLLITARAPWPRCSSSLFHTRALRVAAPPPRFAPPSSQGARRLIGVLEQMAG